MKNILVLENKIINIEGYRYIEVLFDKFGSSGECVLVVHGDKTIMFEGSIKQDRDETFDEITKQLKND